MPLPDKCPLCSNLTKPIENTSALEFTFECSKCGKFVLSRETCDDIDSHLKSEKEKYIISSYVKENNLAGKESILLKPDLFNYILSQAPNKAIEKADSLLKNLVNMSEHFGYEFHLPDDSFNLGYCQNGNEFAYIRNYLLDNNFLEYRPDDKYYITVEGWNRFESLKHTSINSSQVFVAMSFDESMKECYKNAIKLAIEETGYRPYRIDMEEHNGKIDDKIISEIKRSKFLIAEFTEQKQGVYFEAGYAFGLGIEVIWICREDNMDKLHFDTRQYNHITWATTEELKEKLTNRIRAIIGDNNPDK